MESSLLRREGFYLSDFGGDLSHPGRLIALSAVGHRGKKRRICLNEDAINRNLGENIADGLCLGKSDIAGK